MCWLTLVLEKLAFHSLTQSKQWNPSSLLYCLYFFWPRFVFTYYFSENVLESLLVRNHLTWKFWSTCGRQRPTLWVVSSLVPIVSGVALASFSEASFNWYWSHFVFVMFTNNTIPQMNWFSFLLSALLLDAGQVLAPQWLPISLINHVMCLAKSWWFVKRSVLNL